jgi:hypothetical protein
MNMQFRKTLCQRCYHGYSSHAGSHAGLWYIAKIEGPLTWEQLRHWYESGFLDDMDNLLVCSTPGSEQPGKSGHSFQLMSDAFPDPSVAFIPQDVLDKKKGNSSYSTALAALAPLLKNSSVTSQPAATRKTAQVTSVLNSVDATGVLQSSSAPDSDMIDPLESKAKGSQMRSYFLKGRRWYFIDSESKTQGPFPAESMSSWFDAGYFWNKKLMIAHEGWTNFVTLQSILDMVSDDAPAANNHAPTSVDGTVTHRAQIVLTDEGRSGTQSTPSEDTAEQAGPTASTLSPSAGTSSAAALSITSVSKPQKELMSPEKPMQESATGCPDSSDTASELWQYVDESGNVQGPFPAATMAEWVSWGYFTDDVRLRNVSIMPDGNFLPLGVLFPDPGPDATDEAIDATAPFESDCWVAIWKKHQSNQEN